jgi:hypothetical protein
MKSFILKSAFTLITLFTIGALSSFSTKTAFDNAKWTKGPFLSGLTITGLATGLGTGPYELRIQGQYDCVNNGTQIPGSDKWSNLDVTVPVSPKAQGGNFKVTVTIPSQCDHANWTFLVRDLTVTLLQNGTPVIDATAVIVQ